MYLPIRIPEMVLPRRLASFPKIDELIGDCVLCSPENNYCVKDFDIWAGDKFLFLSMLVYTSEETDYKLFNENSRKVFWFVFV